MSDSLGVTRGGDSSNSHYLDSINGDNTEDRELLNVGLEESSIDSKEESETDFVDTVESKLERAGFLKRKIDAEADNTIIYPLTPFAVVVILSDFLVEYDFFVSLTVLYENIKSLNSEQENENLVCAIGLDSVREFCIDIELSEDLLQENEETHNKRYGIISGKVCNEIQNLFDNKAKKKALNLILWCSDEHISLVVECAGNFYFLDSCGFYFRRFPAESGDFFKLGENVFKIESQVQADNLTCGSYCIEFAKALTTRFMQGQEDKSNVGELQKIFNRYMKQFFTGKNGEEFNNRISLSENDESFRTYGLLPSELLIYFQSFKFLRDIKWLLTKDNVSLEKLEEEEENMRAELNKVNNEILKLSKILIGEDYTKLNTEMCDLRKQLREAIRTRKLDSIANIQEELRARIDKIKEISGTSSDLQEEVDTKQMYKKDIENRIDTIKQLKENISKKLLIIQRVQAELNLKLPSERTIQNQAIVLARKEHLKYLEYLASLRLIERNQLLNKSFTRYIQSEKLGALIPQIESASSEKHVVKLSGEPRLLQ